MIARMAAKMASPRPEPARIGRLLMPLADGVVHLEVLSESHREGLRAACAQDREIWEIYTVSMQGADFDPAFDAIMANPDRLAFAVFAGGVLVGMTAYLNINAAQHLLEVGGTYIAPPARATGINRRMKQLMIDHAIACDFTRIEFRIDTRNARSMAAVAKLGALQEGVMRKERTTWTGFVRDTALLSILADEWRPA